MKTQRSFPAVRVTKKCEDFLKEGHLWVYDNEITSQDELENGCIADVVSPKGRYLGSGLVSLESRIRVRLLGNDPNETYGEPFFRRRIGYALDYRATVMGEDLYGSCRLVHGESDGLPGLTVDKYEDILSVQVLSYGMDQRREMLFRLLKEELEARGMKVSGIMERNDVAIREREGLTQYKGWFQADFLPSPPSPVLTITENGVKYRVDVLEGQKTGFFLDQKYNRLAAAKLARGKTVLDCFTHTGSFGLNAALAGAKHVTSVDVSQSAVEMARQNVLLNGLEDRMDLLCEDVFELLPRLAAEHRRYDMVILDPPAFTKSRKTVGSAERGYKEINYRAMKLLPRGGWLATCSCSHFMTGDLFLKMLHSAAKDAGVKLMVAEARQQGPDHPVLLGVPETEYLKFYLLRIV